MAKLTSFFIAKCSFIQIEQKGVEVGSNRYCNQLQPQLPPFRHSFDGTRTYICIVDTPCFAEGPRCVLVTFEWIHGTVL